MQGGICHLSLVDSLINVKVLKIIIPAAVRYIHIPVLFNMLAKGCGWLLEIALCR